MFKNDIGVIGMAVMGRNLTLNIDSHGYTVSIFNRTPQKTEYIIKNFDNKTILPFFSISGFVNYLKKPRCILLMVQSGKATDNIILKLLSYLSSGDIIIDG
ncbi:NAD(P)-binding domain-containing protein, partial [Buchnera aphidicola]|uniref:NAD(P)-binding domain-containing protein n=1 Tax=Buchnera aphidicola TaxID=9 RepID=UPI0022375723|nr:NADP-dependent phosphogluconate dehydrogenase [Buchnera aphidicola (Stegophylla sp.)]